MAKNLDIVETAKSYIGKLKYVFGGNNIAGGSGDCSDFTEHVFAVHGLNIGADTGAQYTQGIAVDRDSLQAGDLVFFKNTYDSGKVDGVSHVGISLGGNQFVHLSSDGCKKSSLTENYWREHYLGAKRVIGVSYEDYNEPEDEPTETGESTPDLKWYGDIIRVVMLILLIILSLTFLGVGVGKNIMMKGVKTNGI